MGCDFDTCPDDSVCVRFFAVASTDATCNHATEDISEDNCDPSEYCTLGGGCVPRTAEVRFCMATCGGNGDCRDGYECRGLQEMMQNGGETVVDPSLPLDDPARNGENLQSFCAEAPQES